MRECVQSLSNRDTHSIERLMAVRVTCLLVLDPQVIYIGVRDTAKVILCYVPCYLTVPNCIIYSYK